MAGIEVMAYFIAVSGLSSTLSLTIEIFSACSAAIASRIGPTARHGPHHSAQKSTMIVLSESSTSLWNVASVTSFAVDILFPSFVGLAGGTTRPTASFPHGSGQTGTAV